MSMVWYYRSRKGVMIPRRYPSLAPGRRNEVGVFQKYRDSKDRPRGPWFVQYPDRIDPQTGKTIWKTIKHGFSKQAAQRFLEAKKTELLDRKDRGIAHQKPLTFQELMDKHLERPDVKAKSSYRNMLFQGRALKEYFGCQRADRIVPGDAETFRGAMLTKGYSPAYVNRHIALMRRAYNLAIRDRLVDRNPCLGINQLSENNERDRVLSFDEWQRLQKELAPHVLALARFAYYTGMRLGEILGLTWDRVNVKEGWIQLRSEDTKTKRPRRVYLTPQASDVLRMVAQVRSIKSRIVFLYKGKPVSSIKTAFRAACRRAGIDAFHFHDLRHCFVTNMRRAGVPKSVIMTMTGHRTENMFHRYNTVDEDDMKAALEKATAYFQGSDYSLVTPSKEKDLEA